MEVNKNSFNFKFSQVDSSNIEISYTEKFKKDKSENLIKEKGTSFESKDKSPLNKVNQTNIHSGYLKKMHKKYKSNMKNNIFPENMEEVKEIINHFSKSHNSNNSKDQKLNEKKILLGKSRKNMLETNSNLDYLSNKKIEIGSSSVKESSSLIKLTPKSDKNKENYKKKNRRMLNGFKTDSFHEESSFSINITNKNKQMQRNLINKIIQNSEEQNQNCEEKYISEKSSNSSKHFSIETKNIHKDKDKELNNENIIMKHKHKNSLWSKIKSKDKENSIHRHVNSQAKKKGISKRKQNKNGISINEDSVIEEFNPKNKQEKMVSKKDVKIRMIQNQFIYLYLGKRLIKEIKQLENNRILFNKKTKAKKENINWEVTMLKNELRNIKIIFSNSIASIQNEYSSKIKGVAFSIFSRESKNMLNYLSLTKNINSQINPQRKFCDQKISEVDRKIKILFEKISFLEQENDCVKNENSSLAKEIDLLNNTSNYQPKRNKSMRNQITSFFQCSLFGQNYEKNKNKEIINCILTEKLCDNLLNSENQLKGKLVQGNSTASQHLVCQFCSNMIDSKLNENVHFEYIVQ